MERRRRLHRMITGATTSAPVESPSHQVIHTMPRFAIATLPLANSVPTPTVAAINVPDANDASVNRATPPGVSKVRRPCDQRARMNPMTKDSAVLPAAMTSAAGSVLDVVRLAANAPTKIAGSTLFPHSMTHARARPVAGQIGDALGLTTAR